MNRWQGKQVIRRAAEVNLCVRLRVEESGRNEEKMRETENIYSGEGETEYENKR